MKENIKIEDFVNDLFHRTNTSTKLTGYYYTIKLVKIYGERKEAKEPFMITKEYQNVAVMGKSSHTVERNLRTCIDRMLNSGSQEWTDIFGSIKWLTNSEYIAGLYEYYSHYIAKEN